MKDIYSKDEFEMFDLCSNKSLNEIKQMIESKVNEDIIRQAFRHYFSRKLAFDNNVYNCRITLEPEGTFGLSTLQMPTVVKIEMDPIQGYIDFYMRGNDERIDLDAWDLEDLCTIVENLEKEEAFLLQNSNTTNCTA